MGQGESSLLEINGPTEAEEIEVRQQERLMTPNQEGVRFPGALFSKLGESSTWAG